MNLLIEYQNELLGLVGILIVIYIYIIIKRKNQTVKITKTDEEVPLEVVQEEEPLAQQTEVIETKLQETQSTLLDGSEEGDFGVVEEKKAPEEKKVKTITKRDVPPHAKINKDDFKEFAGMKILLAEDNIINQKVILGLLADSGINITVANDGAEVLETLKKDDDFTLILMDAHMPRVDGFEATREIRTTPEYDHIVVVALSGDIAVDDIRKMQEAGMSEHLEKPLKMDALYDILYAYAPDEEIQNQNTFHELNIEEGMEISGEDSTFYHEILQEFVESYENAHALIDSFIKHNNIQNADRLLLDIIGLSANIGASNLNKTAINLKTSLQNSDNEKSRLLFKFKEDLENLIKEIKHYLQ